jgi:hypothetical protein
MDHITLDERRLAEDYLGGLLPPDERAAFEVHLVGCEECRDRLLLAEMFRRRAPQPAQDTDPPPTTPPASGTHASNGTPSSAAPSLGDDPSPADRLAGSPSQTAAAHASSPQSGSATASGTANRQTPRVPHHLYSGPERRRAADRRSSEPVRPLPWSRRPAPSAAETISYHAVLQPNPPARHGRRLALAAGVLFAACAGYFTGAATPMLHGSGADSITPYNVMAPAHTREEALMQIVEQSNVVLGGERITLALIRSTLPRYDHSTWRQYQDHSKRLREYHDIFRREYQSLLQLYKTNESMLQKGDILFLEDAITGAEDVERNMHQLESLNLH